MAQIIPPQFSFMPQPQSGGLNSLASLASFELEQSVDLVEVFTGYDTNNQYVIRDQSGMQILSVTEDSSTASRILMGARRPFVMNVLDKSQNIIMRVSREYNPCSGCCWCANACCGCGHLVTVEAPVGNVIGTIKQEQAVIRPRFGLYDMTDQQILSIVGPLISIDRCCCPTTTEYTINTNDEAYQIGHVTKQWNGLTKECCTNSNRFYSEFPMDLSVNGKALLIGATILIDFMFYQRKRK